MSEPEVILAIVGVLATTVGFLGWIIREQFKQNNTTLKEHKNIIESLTDILEKVHKSFDDDRECRKEESAQICKTLDKISATQDEINNRQITLYRKVETEILEDNKGNSGSTTHTVTDTKIMKN